MVVVFDTSICCCSWYSIILGLTMCSHQYNLFMGNINILHIFKDFLMLVCLEVSVPADHHGGDVRPYFVRNRSTILITYLTCMSIQMYLVFL
jgi:hypothetical protein